MERMRTNAHKSLVLQTTVLIEQLGDAPLPCSCTLFSTAGGRAIAFSANGTDWYTTATYDGTSAGAITWGTILPMTYVMFTGAAGDRCEVR